MPKGGTVKEKANRIKGIVDDGKAFNRKQKLKTQARTARQNMKNANPMTKPTKGTTQKKVPVKRGKR